MITQLNATAAEMIATLNLDPAGHDPRLPLRDSALIPALLNPHREYRYQGRVIYEMFGTQWMTRASAGPVTEPGALLKLRERRYPDGTLERDVVRRHWLGETQVPAGRPTYHKATAYSVQVRRIELHRLASLTEEDCTHLGLRRTRSGFTFRNDDLSFDTPHAAAVDHWGNRCTPRFPFVTDNPYVWLIGWDEAVPHLSAAERERAFTEGAENLQRLDASIEAAARDLQVLKNERHLQSERLAQQMQISDLDERVITLHADSRYRLSRHGASKIKDRPA